MQELQASAGREASILRDATSRDEPPVAVLESAAVGPATLAGYVDRMEEFRRVTLRRRKFARRQPRVADRQALAHVLWLCSQKRSAAEAMKFLAALGHFYPEFNKGSKRLQRARRATRGFSKSSPSGSRVSVPHEGIAAIAVELARCSKLDMAVATLVGHHAYLRPQELFSLRCQDVLAPCATTGVYSHWTLLWGLLELRVPTKTGVFDDAVTLDNPELSWLNSHLARLNAGRPKSEIIWPFDRASFHASFLAAVRAAGVESWQVVPYSLRHSGPAWDRASRRLTLPEIQRKGRWLNERTVMRYERSACTLASLSGQPPAFLGYLRFCSKHLRAYVEGSEHPPARAGQLVVTSS